MCVRNSLTSHFMFLYHVQWVTTEKSLHGTIKTLAPIINIMGLANNDEILKPSRG